MRILILLLCLWIPNAKAAATTEQKEMYTQAFQQDDFLISEYLEFSKADNWIRSGLNPLDENIYLSGLPQVSYLKQIWEIYPENISLINSDRLLYQAAHLAQIGGLNEAYLHHYQNAISNYQKALVYFRYLNDSAFVSTTAYNLSRLYFLKNDIVKADSCNEIAISYSKKQHLDFNLIDALIWKTQLALLLHQHQKAENLILQYILKAKHSLKQEQKCYLLLGKLYLKTQRYTEAKWFFLQAKDLAEKTHQRKAQIVSLIYLSEVKNAIRDYHLALDDLQKVKLMSTQTADENKLDLFLTLAQTYAYLHRSKQSAIYLANYKLLKSKITQL